MQDPVTLVGDGHTYERAMIADWLCTHDTSPLTNDPLDVQGKLLVPNIALRNAIQETRFVPQ